MPKVSVILPVYNSEKYLREAIDSILNQTFADFELLLINDGSTDGSEAIIQSYTDERIVNISNEINKGLIYSLNRAIDLAKGELIARMDADDVALGERLEKQKNYLEKNDAGIVATTVKPIDENNNPLPYWKDDIDNVSSQQIKNFLLKDNCIAHPSIMGKAELFKAYKFRYNQKYSEDYDLWLRLVADGVEIHKMNEPLLLYRQLPTSLTRFKKINVFWRLAKVKWRFTLHQLTERKLSAYAFNALLYAGLDVAKAAGKEIKSLVSK